MLVPLWIVPVFAMLLLYVPTWRVRACLVAVWVFAAVAYSTMLTATTYSHYVTPDGSETSDCTLADPCTLTRAVMLVNTRTIPAGSTIHLAAGTYSQAELTVTGSGSAGNLIVFDGADGSAVLDGMRRAAPSPGSWSLVNGKSKTYRATFSTYPIAGVAETCTTRFRPIIVRDPVNGSAFALTYPVRYGPETSIDEVEKKVGSWYVSGTTIYIHTYDNSAPHLDHCLKFTSTNWGRINLSGNYLALRNVTLTRGSSGSGGAADRQVFSSGSNNEITKVTAYNSWIRATGTNNVVDDLTIRWSTQQHPDGNDFADDADGGCLTVGGTGTVATDIDARYAWNCVALTNGATLRRFVIAGVSNHPLGISASNLTIDRGVIVNAQEGTFCRDDVPADNITITRVLATRGLLFNQNTKGCTNVTIRNSILAFIHVSAATQATFDSDYNLFIPANVVSAKMHLYRWRVNFDTLEHVQKNTGQEAHSREASSAAWTDGSLFVHFPSGGNPLEDDWTDADFDFRPVAGAITIGAGEGRITLGPYDWLDDGRPSAPKRLRVVGIQAP